MNAKQQETVQNITSHQWIEWKTGKHIEGALTFEAVTIGDSVMIHASNTASIEWFQKQTIVQIVVGPRGGLNKITVH